VSRVAGVAEGTGGPLVRLAYRLARRDFDLVPGPLRVFARVPRLMQGYGALEWAFAHSGLVDERVKALAVLKAATVVSCEYCVDIGSWEARNAGLTDEQLRALPRYHDSDAFSELEKLVLDYAIAMTRTPADVSDDLYAELRRHFSEPQLVELTTAIALENFRARFNAALAIEPDRFSEGAACEIPERDLAGSA
jgi:AhpD family alkylhydroperoxidase